MPNVYYYGKPTKFVGKTLFEILGNLRNFGVNRVVIKQEELLKNPGQKCYYIVRKVEPLMDSKLEQGAMYAERIYRNAKVPGLVFVEEESWHTDWQLVPKDEENLHLLKPEDLIEHGQPGTVTVLPRWMEVPPLMDIFLKRHYQNTKTNAVMPTKHDSRFTKIMMHYDLNRINKPHMVHRLAEEGEESDSKINYPLKDLLLDNFRNKSEISSDKKTVEKTGTT